MQNVLLKHIEMGIDIKTLAHLLVSLNKCLHCTYHWYIGFRSPLHFLLWPIENTF